MPWVLLLFTFLSFGLLIPRLGFYWDDWPVIYLTQTQGTSGFWDFYQYDRPFSAWTYILFSPMLGTSSWGWHVFVVALRWLSAVFLWLCLRTIWQKKPDAALWAALLFAVNPLFFQQPVAVAYSQHWIVSLLYLGSLYFMLKAQEPGGRFYLFTAAAFALSLVQLFTMEYFVGLELLRPVLLWFYHRERRPHDTAKDTLWRVSRNSAIYLTGLSFFLIWRLFIVKLPGGETNDPILFSQFLQAPIEAFVGLLERMAQDIYYLLTSWIVSVNPLDVSLTRPFSLTVLAVIGFAVGVLWFTLSRYRKLEDEQGDIRSGLDFLGLGFLAIVLAMLPVWMIGRQVTLGGDRFSFAALFGVSVMLVGILDWFSSRRAAKITAIAALLALGIHTNLYTAKAYQNSWERQRDFYWQLFWRAPFIQPGTPLISDGEVFSYVGLYSTSMGISLLYPPAGDPQNVQYWFFNYHEGIVNIRDKVIEGTLLKYSLRNYSFSGQSRESLLIRYDPASQQCLQIFSARDGSMKDIPSYFRDILEISNLSQIDRRAARAGWVPPKNIFGAEPERSWCYYYQKADLARQYGDWKEAARLFDEAQASGFSPGNEREYLLFIDIYLKLTDLEKAYELTMQVESISKRNNDDMCAVWGANTTLLPASEARLYYEKVKTELSCIY